MYFFVCITVDFGPFFAFKNFVAPNPRAKNPTVKPLACSL